MPYNNRIAQNMWITLKVMPPIYSYGNYNRYKEHCLIGQIPRYKTLFFNISPLAERFCQNEQDLCAALVNIYTSGGSPLSPLLKCTTTVLTSTVWCLHKHSASMNVNGCNFLHMEEFSYTALRHTRFHVWHCFVRLPLCCHLSHHNEM